MVESVSDSFSTQWPDSQSDASVEMVGRLIYASLSQVDGPVLQEMRRIRDQAVRNNTPAGLKVALLHIQGWFVEWIEGPDDAMDALLARVDQDARHHSLRVLHRSVGRPRLFRPWIGAIVQSDDTMQQVGRRVIDLQYRAGSDETAEPASVWLALCSPPGRDMRPSVGAYPHVMMLSATGTAAFDLVSWVAHRSGLPLVRRRFAGAADDVPDVGSDYLDLPGLGAQGMRLIANARRGLAMGMTHAFLPDHAAVVLLMDEDVAYSRRLVERMLAACRQVFRSPVIVAAGHAGAIGQEMQALADRQGVPWIAVDLGPRPSLAHTWRVLVPVLARLGQGG